jgi:hypothetical protein
MYLMRFVRTSYAVRHDYSVHFAIGYGDSLVRLTMHARWRQLEEVMYPLGNRMQFAMSILSTSPQGMVIALSGLPFMDGDSKGRLRISCGALGHRMQFVISILSRIWR